MAKMRVYELARELGKETKILEEAVRSLGIEIKNYMSTLTPAEAERVRRHVTGGGDTGTVNVSGDDRTVEKRIAKTVIRRRSSGQPRRPSEDESAPEKVVAAEPAAPVASPTPPVRAEFRPAARPEPPPAARSATPQPRPVAPATPPARAPERPRPPVEPVATAPEPVEEVGPPSAATPSTPSTSMSDVLTEEDDAELRAALPTHQIGSRIELPRGTRRLPGGMAERMTRPGPGGSDAPRGERSPLIQEKPSRPGASVAAKDAGVAGEPRADGPVRTADPAGRRVVRNEDGVIVGAASQRSEPKILGFIPLENRRKRQQVIITDASEEDRRGRASQRKQREERAQAQGRRRKMMRPGRGRGGIAPSRPSTAEMSEAKKRIRMEEAIRVSDLAHQMGQKASNLLKVLWGMGLRGITINHAIDHETAELVGGEFGYTVENVAFDEADITGSATHDVGEVRAPVVTMMGHVDHGKTSLLDRIRTTLVAEGETGGITQHIGAYRVDTAKGPVVFLDTPGHEAFSAMRARGAVLTDVVVLVISADDGVMPTTVEAIKHARESHVPIVVAINKVDKPEANVGRVKQELMEYALVGEEFGGDTSIVEVSAKTGRGIDHLVEILALQAELLELRAPSEGRARGIVIEARIDKGRGTVVTVLLQAGSLEKGDIVVAGEYTGKVRRMFNDQGKPVKVAGPSTPVEVLGFDGVPSAGEALHVVETDRDAKQLVQYRREQRQRKESVKTGPSIQEMLQRKRTPVLKIVLKADVQGSAEALTQALEDLSSDRVKVEVLKSDVGAINETDVKFAKAGDAVIVGFNVKTAGKAAQVAEQERVSIHTFGVIYDALDEAKVMMVGLLEPEYREREQGEAEVRELFPIPRIGVVAGCRVTKGHILRSSHIRVVREGEVLHLGGVGSLRHFKEDVREVKEGFECGIVVSGFNDLRPGDTIQAFDLETIQPTL